MLASLGEMEGAQLDWSLDDEVRRNGRVGKLFLPRYTWYRCSAL